MKNLTGPIIGWHFLRHNKVVIDTTNGLKHFPQITVRVKTAVSQTSAKSQSVLTENNLTILLRSTKTTTAFVDHPLEWNTTGPVPPWRNSWKQQVYGSPTQCKR